MAHISSQSPLLSNVSSVNTASKYLCRPATLGDIPIMAEHATAAYWGSSINDYIVPRAHLHRSHLVRSFRENIRRRFVKLRVLSIVAFLAADPTVVVAYAQFERLGNDRAGFQYGRDRGVWLKCWLKLLSCWFSVLDAGSNYLWPDLATDFAHREEFERWGTEDDKRYWSRYPNRWHANSVVVSPDFQGQGIGKLLMKEVLERAQRERVVVGLSASPHGEKLYRKIGFEMLGDFFKRPELDAGGGGIMIWYPEGWTEQS
ncbi:hypothetical protein B7494_g8290 [Chlorociboria aeruginascens]|nr:hypothetical protein B7494_g8290 [Chlorociboria aeruginascens]